MPLGPLSSYRGVLPGLMVLVPRQSQDQSGLQPTASTSPLFASSMVQPPPSAL